MLQELFLDYTTNYYYGNENLSNDELVPSQDYYCIVLWAIGDRVWFGSRHNFSVNNVAPVMSGRILCAILDNYMHHVVQV